MLKIMKYELKNYYKEQLLLGGGIIVLAFLGALVLKLGTNGSSGLVVLGALLIMVYIFSLISLVVMWIKLVIDSLYKKMFTKEGYLTFSLPVSIDKILIGKFISCFIWEIFILLIAIISLFIFVFVIDSKQEVLFFLKQMFTSGLISPLFIICIIISSIVSTFATIILIMFVISVMYSKSGEKSFTLISILFYIGLNSILSTIINMSSNFTLAVGYDIALDKTIFYTIKDDVIYSLSSGTIVDFTALIPYINFTQVGIYLIVIVAGYFAVRYIISRKLELK